VQSLRCSAERRHIMGAAFTPLMDCLEQRHPAPVDAVLSRSVLEFDGTVSGRIRIRGQAARSNSL
jgi:hypothetical protein